MVYIPAFYCKPWMFNAEYKRKKGDFCLAKKPILNLIFASLYHLVFRKTPNKKVKNVTISERNARFAVISIARHVPCFSSLAKPSPRPLVSPLYANPFVSSPPCTSPSLSPSSPSSPSFPLTATSLHRLHGASKKPHPTSTLSNLPTTKVCVAANPWDTSPMSNQVNRLPSDSPSLRPIKVHAKYPY